MSDCARAGGTAASHAKRTAASAKRAKGFFIIVSTAKAIQIFQPSSKADHPLHRPTRKLSSPIKTRAVFLALREGCVIRAFAARLTRDGGWGKVVRHEFLPMNHFVMRTCRCLAAGLLVF